MQRTYYFIITTVWIILTSCQNGIISDTSIKLQTIPEKVKQGQLIEITLSETISPNEILYAKIGSLNKNGNHTQYRLRFYNENGILKVKFKVPDNSTFLKIDYEKKNEINDFKSLFKVVYEGDRPCLSGLVFSLRNSRDLEELNSIHCDNEKLYPNNKLSWGMANYLKRKRFHSNISINEADSVYMIVEKNKNSISKEDLFDNLSSCFMGYCLENNWLKAKSILLEMKQYNFEKIIPSGLALDNLALFVRENSIGSFATLEAIRFTDDTKSIFIELFSWKKIYNTGVFRATTIKRIDSIDANSDLLNSYIQEQTNFYLETNSLNLPYECADYMHMTEILKWRKEYPKAIAMGLKGREVIHRVLTTNIWDTVNIVEGLMEPADGLYASLLLQVATCAELNNNDSLAESLYVEIINHSNRLYNSSDFIHGPKSLASIYLTELYIRKYQFDNAKKILLKAYTFRSPFANSTFELLQKSLKKAGLDTLTLSSYLHKSIEELYPKATNFEVPSDKGYYNLQDSNHVLTFCFFLNGQCSVCDNPVFYAIDILNSHPELDKNIVIFANREQLEYFKGIGKNIFLIEIKKSILNNFGINELPYSLVVKSGRILGMHNNIPKSKNAWLFYLGLLKSPDL